MPEALPPETPANPEEAHAERLNAIGKKMGENFLLLSAAENLPRPGPEHGVRFRQLLEHYRKRRRFIEPRPEVYFLEPDKKAFYDAETGLQVEPEFAAGYYVPSPDRMSIRFSVPSIERTAVAATARWLTYNFDPEAAKNLREYYDKERTVHYFSGYMGPVQLEIRRPANVTPYNVTYGNKTPRLMVGAVHYSNYNVSNEDQGVRGHGYDLTEEQLTMFAGVLDRAVSRLVSFEPSGALPEPSAKPVTSEPNSSLNKANAPIPATIKPDSKYL